MNWYKRQLKIAGGPRREWSTEELEEIKKLIQKGKSYRYVGEMFKVSPRSIEGLNKKYQWLNKKEELIKKYRWIASLYLLPPEGKGISGYQLRKEYGLSNSDIVSALKFLNKSEFYRFPNDKYVMEQRSRSAKEWWEDHGRLEGYLTSISKEAAISFLNNLVSNINKTNNRKAFSVYNKYMQIIENHTYPDEVQQGATV